MAAVGGVELFARLIYPEEAAAGMAVATLSGWALAPLAVPPHRVLAAMVRVATAATLMAWIAAGVVLFLGGGAVLLLILLWSIRLGDVGQAIVELLPGTIQVFLSVASRVAIVSIPTAVVWVFLMRAVKPSEGVALPVSAEPVIPND